MVSALLQVKEGGGAEEPDVDSRSSFETEPAEEFYFHLYSEVISCDTHYATSQVFWLVFFGGGGGRFMY